MLSWSWFLSLWFDVFLVELFLAWIWDLGVLVWCLCPSVFLWLHNALQTYYQPGCLLNQFLVLMDLCWIEFWAGLNWECLFLSVKVNLIGLTERYFPSLVFPGLGCWQKGWMRPFWGTFPSLLKPSFQISGVFIVHILCKSVGIPIMSPHGFSLFLP